MKHSIFLTLCLAACLINACNQHKNPQEGTEKKKEFLPVTEFLAGEIKRIDSVPYSFLRYTTIGDKTDSAFIDKAAFHKMIDEFLEVNIRDKKYQLYYDETSLIDTSTRLASFTYLANSPAMKVSRMDAYIDPETGKFKKIFIKRVYKNNDTLFEKQLFWQTTGNFSLITSETVAGKETIKQEKVIWDDKEE